MPRFDDLISRISRQKGVSVSRMERIKREGSKYYVHPGGVIAAGADEAIHVPTQFPDSRKYEPLDWLEIVNNETSIDIIVTINGGDAFIVPAKSIRQINNTALWHINIHNNHGVNATTAGLIRLTLQKEPLTMDKWIRSR
ncbi:hypothetical protein ES703_35391 [subsurface metagenome]